MPLAVAYYTIALAIIAPLANGNQNMQQSLAILSGHAQLVWAVSEGALAWYALRALGVETLTWSASAAQRAPGAMFEASHQYKVASLARQVHGVVR